MPDVKIADMGARPFDDGGVMCDQCIEFVGERHDLGRIGSLQLVGLAVADRSQGAPQAPQWL